MTISNPVHKELLELLTQDNEGYDIHLFFNDPQTILRVVFEYDLGEEDTHLYHYEPMIAGNC